MHTYDVDIRWRAQQLSRRGINLNSLPRATVASGVVVVMNIQESAFVIEYGLNYATKSRDLLQMTVNRFMICCFFAIRYELCQ